MLQLQKSAILTLQAERLEEWVQTKDLYDTETQQQTVLNVLHEGKAVYQNIIERAERLGRRSPYVGD